MGFDKWLVGFPRRPGARLRLVCFPHAGASAGTYAAWREWIPADVELCAVQLPGRGNRSAETRFTRMTPLVHSLAEWLTPAPDAPYVFFGHSLGGLIAFELARLLRQLDTAQPRALFVSACEAPHLVYRPRPLHRQSESEFRSAVQALGGTPSLVMEDADVMELLSPILRADFEILETYVCNTGAPLDQPITVYGGISDPMVGQAQLDGWRIHTRSRFELVLCPGDHWFVHADDESFRGHFSSELRRIVRTCA